MTATTETRIIADMHYEAEGEIEREGDSETGDRVDKTNAHVTKLETFSLS